MDSQDPSGAIGRLVTATRKATRIVQLFPFVYLVASALYLIFGSLVGDKLLSIIDSVLYQPSVAPVVLIVLSRVFKLCRWHKVACILPSSTRLETIVDTYLFQFTETEIVLINIILGIIFLAFIYSAFKHFFLHGRKRNHKANA